VGRFVKLDILPEWLACLTRWATKYPSGFYRDKKSTIHA